VFRRRGRRRYGVPWLTMLTERRTTDRGGMRGLRLLWRDERNAGWWLCGCVGGCGRGMSGMARMMVSSLLRTMCSSCVAGTWLRRLLDVMTGIQDGGGWLYRGVMTDMSAKKHGLGVVPALVGLGVRRIG